MHTTLRSKNAWARTAVLSSAMAAALLAGCGGGSSGAIPLPSITAVKVMGDSLADVGTYNFKFTVQGTATDPQLIYPERVARSYNIAQHCSFFAFDGTTFVANTAKTGCTNFAIGGGRINGATARDGLGLEGGAADPRNVGVQLQTAVAAGNHSANDLLLIDGGGNDAADIIGLYLAIGQAAAVSPAAQQAAIAAYGQALNSITLLSAVDLTTEQGLADAGGIYMRSLASRFYDQVKADALDKGAQHVVLLNIPAVTVTPRFLGVLNFVAAANGGGTAGAAARTAAENLFKNWIVAFNSELARRANGESRVVLVDFYNSLLQQVANPSVFGLTNVTGTACPADVSPSCTAAALSASNPPWSTYLFADSFHPTPRGHELAAEQIRSALFNASWQ